MPHLRTQTLAAAVASTACMIATLSANADVIYQNTDAYTGARSFTALWIGDEVTAAGTDRTVTALFIGVSMQGFVGTADLQARLYANDGVDGQPGTLLWESALMDDVALTGNDDLIQFNPPSIVVPDTFTWMLQASDTDPVAVGMPHYDPITVGDSPEHAWFGSGDGSGNWTMLTNQGRPVNFMALIETGFDGGVNLTVDSSCPGGGPATISWEGATPNGQVAVVFAATTGSEAIPNGFPCAGTVLGLGNVGLRLAFVGASDANGSRTVNGTIPAPGCGGFLQAIDISTCATSNVPVIQ